MSNSADAGAQTVVVNPAPANVSTVDLHPLLPAGTKIVVHSVDWFTSPGSGDHTQTGYNSNDKATIAAQDDSMIARHIDGRATDWYGPFNTVSDGAAQKISADLAARCSSPQACQMEWRLIYDQGAVTRQQGTRAGCSLTDESCLQTNILHDLCYANGQYFGTAAYIKENSSHLWLTSTSPTVGFFPPSSTAAWNTAIANLKAITASNGWAASNCPAGEQQANGGLIFFDSDTTNVAQSPYSGGSSWVDVLSWNNQFTWDGSNNNTYHESLYSSCNANPADLCSGSAKKGFNDYPTPTSSPPGTFASWGTNRVMAQQCGQVWAKTIGLMNSKFTGSNGELQLVTWNDYEEGTEIESGIDNCYAIASTSLAGSVFSWTLSTSDATYAPLSPTNGTIDHFAVIVCNTSDRDCGEQDVAGSASSLDLSTLGLASGSYHVWVEMVGINSIQNRIAPSAIAYTH